MKKFICITLFSIFIYSAYSQNRKIFFLNEGTSVQNKFVAKNSLNTYVNISEGYFVTNGEYSPEGLKNIITKLFPGKNDTGYAVLDWESAGMHSLVKQDSKFAYFLGQFIMAIEDAKRLRPKVKWSYYAVPYKYYESSPSIYTANVERLSKLFKALDFIAPSLYILKNEAMNSIDMARVDETLSIALKLGNKYSKPVYPFIWHRIHPSNKRESLSLVNARIFDDYIGHLLNYKYKNIGISGLIWWHTESYSYGRRAKSLELQKAYSSIKDFDNFQNNTFNNYYNLIKKHL